MRTTPAAAGTHPADENRVKVWDPLVRITHWTLAVAFFVAYFTEDDLLTLHVWAGYTVGILVVLRVLWGFVGPRHARFVDFLYGPGEVWRYLIALVALRAKRYLGHSPAGGAMVFALLVGLAATVWSGLELYAVENNAGPLAEISVEQIPGAPRTSGMEVLAHEGESDLEHQEDHEKLEKPGGEFWEDVHEILANIVLALVLIHIAGVLLASAVHMENLARSMVTGLKRSE